MSAHTLGEWILLYVTVMIVIAEAFAFKRIFWNAPLKNGPGFFLGVKISPGFYEGEGIRWLRCYHALLLAVNLILALALLAILLSGRWLLLAPWAGGVAVLHVSTFLGFTGYTRATLGASLPVHSTVALALESRQLRDYVSWRVEALIGIIAALSWALLVSRGDAQVHWKVPVVLTYVILGALPLKIACASMSLPLPAERPEEHYRWMEAQRRFLLGVVDLTQWFLTSVFGAYALLHGWRLMNTSAWLHWLLIGIVLAIWLLMVVTILRRAQRLTDMGRDLLPVGSWSTPFRPARMMAPGFAIWFAVWFGGLVLLLVFFHG
jgi:hypothetical protein